MFPEYRELITQLKTDKDAHFIKLFDRHNMLDNEISELEKDPVSANSRSKEIEGLKREKLGLKDEIHQYLIGKSA